MSIPKPREAPVLRACLDYLRLRGVFCWRANQGPVPCRGGYRFSGLPGVPDVLGVLPRLANGREGVFLGVEVKRPGGRLSQAQRLFLHTVNRLGGVAVVVSSVRELEAALREAGLPCLREAGLP